MNKKYIILICILIIVIVAIIGFTVAVLTAHTTYKDDYIGVEVPAGTELKLINNTTALDYNATNKNLRVWLFSVNLNESLGNTSYNFAKDTTLDQLKQWELNPSKHDYDGSVYKYKNDTTNNITYSIVLFFNDRGTIVLLESDNLDTVIHMAETFKLLKPFIIKTEINSTTNTKKVDTPKKQKSEYDKYLDAARDDPRVKENGWDSVMSKEEFYESGEDIYY